MLEKNLQKLEYEKIIERVCSYGVTYIGKELCNNLVPKNDAYIVKQELKQTNLAISLILRKGELPLENISNISLCLKSLKSNYSLSAKCLLDIANVLKISYNLNNYFYGDVSFDLTEYEILKDLFDSLYYNKNIENKILNSIIDENTIADDASSSLLSLRRNKRKLEQNIRDVLSNFIHSSKFISNSNNRIHQIF